MQISTDMYDSRTNCEGFLTNYVKDMDVKACHTACIGTRHAVEGCQPHMFRLRYLYQITTFRYSTDYSYHVHSIIPGALGPIQLHIDIGIHLLSGPTSTHRGTSAAFPPLHDILGAPGNVRQLSVLLLGF